MNSRETFKRVLSYIDKYKYYLILSLVFAFVSVAMVLYAPILVGNAIDCIIGPDNVDFEKITAILIKLGLIIGATAVLQ